VERLYCTGAADRAAFLARTRGGERDRHEIQRAWQIYWVWVMDSGDKQNCSAAFYGLQGVGMYGCKIGSANKQRDANVTVVVPL
jgi:hypothetical protein